MKNKIGLTVLAGVLAMPVVFAEEKVLVFCSAGSPDTFNPQLSQSATTFNITRQIYDQLVLARAGDGKLMPGLATQWEVSKDGLEYTFHLRKGVKFHTTGYFKPSRDFNADDVVFSFDRQMNPKNPYHNVSGGSYLYFANLNLNKIIKSVDKVDDYTVKFTLTQPYAPFIQDLVMPMGSILSKEYADQQLKKKQPGQVDLKPVGTGAYQFLVYEQDAMTRFRANPDYWRGKTPVDNLVFVITKDSSVRYQKLQKGECQVMINPNPNDVASMKKNPDLHVEEIAGLATGFLGYNVTKKPLDNVKVRQALSMAVDRQAIIDAIYQGLAEPGVNPFPPGMWSYNKSIKPYPFDMKKAKQLLTEAGFSKGFEVELWAMPVQRSYNPNGRRMATMIQANWAKLGVKAKIITYEWGEYLKRLSEGQQDVAMDGWNADINDPDNYFSNLLSCAAVGAGNDMQWCYQPFNDVIVKAAKTSDHAERVKLYEKAQEIFHEQIPYLPIAYPKVIFPMRKEVIGFKADIFGRFLFYGVDLKK